MEYEIICEKDFQKARKKIREAKQNKKKVVFSGDGEEINRKVLEKEDIDVLLINLKDRKDYQKQRNSGFNQVFAKAAKKNNVVIGINLDEIIESRKLEKSKILARVRQNIMLCNKNKVKVKFLNFKKENERNRFDLKALGLVLGMPTWMTKEI